MQILDSLLKRGIINKLIFRDISNSLDIGEYVYVEDALAKHGIDITNLKDIRSEIFSIEKYQGDVEIDKDLANYFSEDICRANKILPLSKSIIGILNPEQEKILKTIEDIAHSSGLVYRLQIISKDEYEKGLELLLNISSNSYKEEGDEGLVLKDVSRVSVDSDKKQIDDISTDHIDLNLHKNDLEKIQISKLVDSILYMAIQEEASDIHIEHTGEKSRVRFRMDGTLASKIEMNPNMHKSILARIKILSDMKLDEKRKPQDGRFSVRVKNGNVTHKIDFRVSTMPAYYGEKVVMRILDSYRGIRKLESVGFSEIHLNQIRRALEKPYGMIIISGPTGSGKTTTLYSMLNELDRERRNVVSLEDPIEYNVPNMNQSQIFPEIGYTFATGLRSILRQDPDVIMVGEIRDKETAELAIQAALTGHLVFSTIHTNNSIGVITRLMDMGVDPYLIAPTIILAIAQRLAPMIHPSCASPIAMTPAIENLIEVEFRDLKEEYKTKLDLTRPFYESLPNETFLTGTKGRMPILEVLEVDDDIQNAILQRKNEDEIFKIARERGMITMKEDAMLKSMEGKVPFVEIAGL